MVIIGVYWLQPGKKRLDSGIEMDDDDGDDDDDEF